MDDDAPIAATATSGAKVYSVQRRFDLSTLFVMTTVFSIVFALVRWLGGSLAPAVMIAGNILVVGAAQAYGENRWPARKASIYVGAAYWGVGVVILRVAVLSSGTSAPGIFVLPIALVQGGIAAIPGALLGYLAGAVAAGVFLIADVLRNGWSPELLTSPFAKPETSADSGMLRSLLDAQQWRRADESPSAAPPPFSPAANVYSVQRRFDLATLFVMTTAFCAVFALIRFLGWSLTAAMLAAGCIAFVGFAQAMLRLGWSPRVVSMFAGAVYWTAYLLIFSAAQGGVAMMMILTIPFAAVGGAVLGYVAGVGAAGVFLVADKLRNGAQKLARDGRD